MASATDSRFDKGYGCYFYEQAARDLFCGHLDPVFEAAEGFSESTIADFVRAAKPSLFRQLGGLPVPSTGIRRPNPASENGSSQPTSGHSSARSTIRGRSAQNQCLTGHEAGSSTVRQPQCVEQYMLDLQHKRHIQLRVLNGYDLTIRKLNVPSLVLPCSDPQCAAETSVMREGAFFLILSESVLDPAGAVVKKLVLHYSLTCLEGLFDRGLSHETPYEVDGYVDRPGESAHSICHNATGEVTCQVDGLVDVNGFPYHYPSNAPEAIYLRGQRDDETELLPLTPVRGKRQANAVQSPVSKTPNLKLSRANDVSPFIRRYRKQGLTYERSKSRTSEQLEIDRAAQVSRPKQEVRICYCREAANGLELVQCSSPNCMIGLFHLGCLNLQEPLEEGDEVYCDYCAENLSADNDSETVEDTHTVTRGVHAEDEGTAETASPVPELLEDRNVQVRHPEETASSATDTSSDAVTPGHNGFVAINDPKICPNIHRYAQADGARSPVPATPYLKPTSTASCKTELERQKKQSQVPLQPGSSQISFADLAPFISLSHLAYSPLGLTNHEARVFLHWKNSCPRSRLLEALPIDERIEKGLKPSEAWYPVNPQGYVLLQNGFAPRKLSELLELVRGT